MTGAGGETRGVVGAKPNNKRRSGGTGVSEAMAFRARPSLSSNSYLW